MPLPESKQKLIMRRLPWLCLSGYWIMLAVSTHVPRIPDGMEIHVKDKVLHFVAFLVLTLLYWLAVFGRQRPSPRRRGLWLTLILLAAYSAVDEATQRFVGRHVSLLDWLSNLAGVVVALGMLAALRRWSYWLAVYWVALLVITHWPKPEPLIKLPPHLAQYDLVYYLAAYVALTVLWWRSWCPRTRFAMNAALLWSTAIALGGYALFDQWLNRAMNRPFDGIRLPVALAGIAVGMAFSILMVWHGQEMERQYPVAPDASED